MNFFLQYVRLNLGYLDKLLNRSVTQKRVALKKSEPDTKSSQASVWNGRKGNFSAEIGIEREGEGDSVRARVSLARSRAQIPFPFPFERLPRGLNPRPRADVS